LCFRNDQEIFFTPESSEFPPLLIPVIERIPAITMLTSGDRGKKQDPDTGQRFTLEDTKTVLIVRIVQVLGINDIPRDEETPFWRTINNSISFSIIPTPVTPT
jgi:hypothetical protein